MSDFKRAWDRHINDDFESMYGFSFEQQPNIRILLFPKNNGQTWDNNEIWRPGKDETPITSVQVILEAHDAKYGNEVTLSKTEFIPCPPKDGAKSTNTEIIAQAKSYALLYAAQYFQNQAQDCMGLYVKN